MSITFQVDLAGLQRISEAVGIALKQLRQYAQPGMTTKEVDDYGGHLLAAFGAKPAPRLTYGFPG